MAAVRRNILADDTARDQYIEGAKLLKQEFLGPTTQDLGIAGPAVEVSTYDLFVAWHHLAMFTFTPPSQGDRNAAHRGPVFLPWHRFMLLLLELQFQRVLNDDNFGIPYWDWAADGELDSDQQAGAPIWSAKAMGGQGAPVSTGPFAFDATDPTSWRVLLEVNVQGQLRATNRGLRRVFGQSVPTLPRKAQVKGALALTTYDTPPWNTTSAGFRNQVEGWLPADTAPGLHNRVHVWVGGDMLPSSSPNDPVFYLNHCNEDRIWTAWQTQPGTSYLPDQSAPETLRGHRIDDAMHALLSDPVTPRQMLDVSDFSTYDTLVVA
ncbi:MAG TPA: tyrosinase family protein [Egibacteraceae bacterium]|nr:tyrosinase family protein [Egibacteraceae bacterium]